MTAASAGILLYRIAGGGDLEVFLVHPGGPYWATRDDGAWSIPKGEIDADEDLLAAARREFAEETGQAIDGRFVSLQTVRQPGGKVIHAWAVEGEFAADALCSNTFSMEWPPRSGRKQTFPEIDRGQWFSLAMALRKINRGQQDLLHRLSATLAAP